MGNDNENLAEEYGKEGTKYILDKKYACAVASFTNAIELNPYVGSYYENRSYCFLKLNSFEQSKKDAIKAIELHPNASSNCYLLAAKCCIMTGNPKEANEWLQNMGKSTRFYKQTQKIKELIERFQDFKTLFDNQQYFQAYDKIEALLQLEYGVCFELYKVLCLVYIKKFGEALKIINKLSFEDTSRSDVCSIFNITALILYFKGEFSKVSTYLQESLSLTDDIEVVERITELWRKSSKLESFMLKARIAIEEKKYSEALSYYNEALKVDSSNKFINCHLHFLRAKALIAMGNYVDAIKDLSTTLNDNSSNVHALLLRTECFEKLKRIEERQKNMMTFFRNQKRYEQGKLNPVSRKRTIDGRLLKGNGSLHPITRDFGTQSDFPHSSYEISFVPKNLQWTLSKKTNGVKSDFPFAGKKDPNVKIDIIENESRELVYKIKLFE